MVNWNNISPIYRDIIRKEIKEMLETNHFGMRCDWLVWHFFLKELKELEKEQEETKDE